MLYPHSRLVLERGCTHGADQVLAALATGLLPVTALPPVIRRFPAERLPTTFEPIVAFPLDLGAVCFVALLMVEYHGMSRSRRSS